MVGAVLAALVAAGLLTGGLHQRDSDGRGMVSVPPGEFVMGSPANEAGRFDDERPQQTVRFTSGFRLDATEVTNSAYARFVEANSQWSKAGIDRKLNGLGPEYGGIGTYLEDWKGAAPPAGKADYPVTSVSWYAAKAYCVWAGKRLPTEAEWEYAARAGTTTAYWWGDEWDATRAVSRKQIQPVGEARRTNPWGLADMLGNVWEWTSTQFRPYPYRADDGREDPSGDPSRVTRGGSFIDSPQLLRAARRHSETPSQPSIDVGFRCAQ